MKPFPIRFNLREKTNSVFKNTALLFIKHSQIVSNEFIVVKNKGVVSYSIFTKVFSIYCFNYDKKYFLFKKIYNFTIYQTFTIVSNESN